MGYTSTAKIKKFLKRILPFVKYRWRIYDALKKKDLFFAKFNRFFYYKIPVMLSSRDLSQEMTSPTNCRLEIETVNESNRAALKEFVEKNLTKDKKLLRNWLYFYYQKKNNGFIATIEGKIIGYILWWSKNQGLKTPEEILFYNVKLEEGEAYGLDFFISPQYRGKGNAVEFVTKYFIELKKLGYSCILGIYEPSNLPAKWTYQSIGFEDKKKLITHIFLNYFIYHEKVIYIKKYHWHPGYAFACHKLLSYRQSSKGIA